MTYDHQLNDSDICTQQGLVYQRKGAADGQSRDDISQQHQQARAM
jgi:hypothetical protein